MWKSATARATLFGLVFSAAIGVAQSDESPRGARRFSQLDWLAGEWRGFGKFAKTTNYIHKKFTYEVGGTILTERTVDLFPPAEPSADFEIHQDLIVYYRVGPDGPFRAKGFYVETFVTSMEVTVGDGGDSVTLETTQVETLRPGCDLA